MLKRREFKNDVLCNTKFNCDVCGKTYCRMLMHKDFEYNSPIIKSKCFKCKTNWLIKIEEGEVREYYLDAYIKNIRDGCKDCSQEYKCYMDGSVVVETYVNKDSQYLTPLMYFKCLDCKKDYTLKYEPGLIEFKMLST